MIAEIGMICLIYAWLLSFLNILSSAKIFRLQLQLGLILAAFFILIQAFYLNDFSLTYVYSHSNSHLPLFYRLAAVWGGHEGSMLLWVLILQIGLLLFNWQTESYLNMDPELISFRHWVNRIISSVLFCFLGYILFLSNPFLRNFQNLGDGMDLNPILQDPSMLFHPPMLYFGYVTTALPFAMAIAALFTACQAEIILKWIRQWCLLGWCMLTIGITAGSFWAYYELGWGGFWFWDPVENASFMPWLILTAILHVSMVSHKYPILKSWMIFLCIFNFILSIIGTFLVRSGIISSVHAFASDPSRGLFFLFYIGGLLIFSMAVLIFKLPHQTSEKIPFLSKEHGLFLNSILLFTAATAILMGTVYPILLQGLNIAKISVGAPYFNHIFNPLILMVIALMGITPSLQWGKWEAKSFFAQIQWPIMISFLFTVGIALFYLGFEQYMVLCCIFLAAFVWMNHWSWMKNHKMAGFAHLSVVVIMLGICISTHFQKDYTMKLSSGQSQIIQKHRFTLKNLAMDHMQNYSKITADFAYSPELHLYPERRIYDSNQMELSKTAIRTNIFHDLYLQMGESFNDHSWEFVLYDKPLVRLIWIGGFLLAFFGFVRWLQLCGK